MPRTITRTLALLALLGVAAAHEGHDHGASSDMGGMDMSGDSMSDTMGGNEHAGMAGMKMYMHGSIGEDRECPNPYFRRD